MISSLRRKLSLPVVAVVVGRTDNRLLFHDIFHNIASQAVGTPEEQPIDARYQPIKPCSSYPTFWTIGAKGFYHRNKKEACDMANRTALGPNNCITKSIGANACQLCVEWITCHLTD